MCGWIKIHRSLLQWEWFQKPDMVQLFMYLLLKANVEDRKWQGIDVKRGQVVTSVATICRDLSLSTKKIRNCLEHLKNSQVVSIKTTNKFSVITICNYATYQAYEIFEGQTRGKRGANRGQHLKNIRMIRIILLLIIGAKKNFFQVNFWKNPFGLNQCNADSV